jgi:hypothetical protein
VTPERREHLKRTLPAEKRPELIKDLKLAPVWMHPIFRELAEAEAYAILRCRSLHGPLPAAPLTVGDDPILGLHVILRPLIE